MTVQPLWTASGGGSVVWSIRGVALGDGDGLDAAVSAPVTLTDALATADALHADTLDAPARLLGLRVFYRVDAASDD